MDFDGGLWTSVRTGASLSSRLVYFEPREAHKNRAPLVKIEKGKKRMIETGKFCLFLRKTLKPAIFTKYILAQRF